MPSPITPQALKVLLDGDSQFALIDVRELIPAREASFLVLQKGGAYHVPCPRAVA